MAKSAKTAKAAPKPAAKTAKKPAAKPAKPAAKASARHTAKKPAPKPATKAQAKAPAKVAAKAGKDAKATKPAKPGAKPAPAQPDTSAEKKGPKGITVVQPKVVKKTKPKVKLEMPHAEPLIKPGMKWKPLIPSGPKAPPSPYGVWRSPDDVSVEEVKIDPKARLPKKELERYRDILLRKRAELLGDITGMEREALNSGSGSLSSLPQHMAEQGSDTYDQHLSLDLAAVDRELIKEIDEALSRIDSGIYGVCLKTGKRINADRLNEIPWARYSIQAAREMERNIHLPSSASTSESSANSDMD
ncbi:MAG: TraR/DksA family transcriptional regulator [Phycisphaeraceae bacterium]|nr:TraR/DksA family transcriptional regulator [Phycisphaeraceae bacterium]